MTEPTGNWRQDAKIDLDVLHLEVRDNAELFAHYGELYISAKRSLKRKQRALKVVFSQLYLEAKRAGSTDSTSKQWVESHPAYLHTETKVMELESMVDRLKLAVDTFKDRRYLLQELVYLHNSAYFQPIKATEQQMERIRNRSARVEQNRMAQRNTERLKRILKKGQDDG